MNKREFIKTLSLASAASVLPLSLSCTKEDQVLRTAHIGVGNMGLVDLQALAAHPQVQVTALCDVDKNYLKVAQKLFPEAQIFSDYRIMFQTYSHQIDAVVVSTPDHTHAPASIMAMEHNKSVYCQKPLTHYVSESREMRQLAQQKQLVTQMGIQVHSFYDYQLATVLIQGGIVGRVTKVIAWSNKNWGYNGPVPEGADPIPEQLDWNLWLGTSAERDYKEAYYHPMNWRKLVDYGCATLGDMGVHIFDTPYNALKLDLPDTITNYCQQTNGYGYPERNYVHYTFQGTSFTTSNFEWVWFDGVQGPEITKELLLPKDQVLPAQGAMFIGEDGRRLLLPHFMELPKFIQNGEFKEINISEFDPDNRLGEPVRDYDKESLKHYHQFVDACLGKDECTATFQYASQLTETILLGVIAGRFPGKTLHYDKNLAAFLEEEANSFLSGNYRKF